MNRKLISLAGCVLFAVIVGLSLAPLGCAPRLVGETAAVYSVGQLHARVNGDLDAAYEASVTALERLEVTITEKEKDVNVATIEGKTSDELKIKIKMKTEMSQSTLLTIQVGAIGNEKRSCAIYDKIREVL